MLTVGPFWYTDSIKYADLGLSAITIILKKITLQNNSRQVSLRIINTLLPNPIFLEEPSPIKLTTNKIEKFGLVKFLNQANFLISKDSTRENHEDKMYKILYLGRQNCARSCDVYEGNNGWSDPRKDFSTSSPAWRYTNHQSPDKSRC